MSPAEGSRYVALLRGINVGRNKRVAMADLRELLTGYGHQAVRTHLNSGNVVFSSDQPDPATLAAQIEQGLADQLGVTAACHVLTGTDLQAVVDSDPFGPRATNGSRYLTHFLFPAPDPALLAAHDPRQLDPENTALGERVIYQWCPDGILQAPPVGGFAEKHLGVAATARNWNTVTKLATLL
ncbi:DUF1697 domain-containing protein [Rhodococcus sp. X156]|uniref:DUF1697 domain-containing protein n=1 Tax=Rhodococcus sp. X156 TaxID=2499145 RepID=UPI000FD73E9C|nr:DUF1697 domain-containing protein [Rhodococcus sp. X156]